MMINIFNDFTPGQIESFEDYYAGVADEIDKRSAAWGYLMGTMSPSESTDQQVSVSLRDGARALHKRDAGHLPQQEQDAIWLRDIDALYDKAKSCAETWGLSYVD